MNAYKKFGYYYDEIMQEINYELWFELTEPYLNKGDKILDLACGSGTYAILASILGYKVTGLDLSETIIEIAKEKTKINHCHIDYYVSDMLDYNINDKFNLVTCFFDSVNFLKNEQELDKLIENAYNSLLPGGYFIFDIFSSEMLKEYENNILENDYESFKIKWITTKIDPEDLKHSIDIVDSHETLHEEYYEHFFDYTKIKPKGFEIIKIVGDFNDDLEPEDERIFFILKKKNA